MSVLVQTKRGERNDPQDFAVPGSKGAFTVELETAFEAGITRANTLSSQNAVVPGTLTGSLFIGDREGW